MRGCTGRGPATDGTCRAPHCCRCPVSLLHFSSALPCPPSLLLLTVLLVWASDTWKREEKTTSPTRMRNGRVENRPPHGAACGGRRGWGLHFCTCIPRSVDRAWKEALTGLRSPPAAGVAGPSPSGFSPRPCSNGLFLARGAWEGGPAEEGEAWSGLAPGAGEGGVVVRTSSQVTAASGGGQERTNWGGHGLPGTCPMWQDRECEGGLCARGPCRRR